MNKRYMSSRSTNFQQFFAKMNIGGSVSINDLRDREFSGEYLNEEERLALYNFDRFRIEELNAQPSDVAFHERYRQLQVMANLSDWREFLDIDNLRAC
ncbi:MAG: hypothetical protein MUC87_09715 [Bacteroidia bacterium]|nr:hypothetical protein [Bacteroidia bacterium]